METRPRTTPDDHERADGFLRGFVTSLPGAVVLVDGDLVVWSANPAAAELLGRPVDGPEGITGRPVLDLFALGSTRAVTFAAAVRGAARRPDPPGGAPGGLLATEPPTTFTVTPSAVRTPGASLRVSVGHVTMGDHRFATLVLDPDEGADGNARSRFTGQGADAPVPLWITGVDATTTWYNAAWSEMTGYPARLDLDEWADLIHPDDRDAVVAAYRDAVSTRRAFELQYRLRSATGVARHVLDRGAPYRDHHGRYAGWVGSTVDVSELVEAKDALALREHRQAAASMLGRMALGPAPIEEIRQAAVDLLHAELHTDAADYFTPIDDLPNCVLLAHASGPRPDRAGGTFPRHQLFWTRASDDDLADGLLVPDWRAETELVAGTFVAQYGYRSSMAVAVPGETGRRPDVIVVHCTRAGLGAEELAHLRYLAQVVGAAATERRTTRALLDRETVLTLSMEAGRMGHWVWDRTTTEAHFSPGLEAICGREPGELGNRWRAFSRFILPSDRWRARRELFPADPTETEVHTEFRITKPDGDERWLEIRGRAVPGSSPPGTPPRRWVGVAIDVTEQKAAEREARVMAGLSDLFASRHGFDTILERVVRAVVPHLADTCSIHLVGDTPTARRWWLADTDPEVQQRIDEAQARRDFDPLTLLPDLDRPGHHKPILLGEITDADRRRVARDDRDLELFGRHGATSAIVAPLEARGRVLGLLTLELRGTTGHRYAETDLRAAEELARRVANAVDNARLERDARQARDRLDVLARVGNILTVSLDSDARLRAVAQAVVPSFADACLIHSGPAGGNLKLSHVATADPKLGELVAAAPHPTFSMESDVRPAEALRSGRPILLENPAEFGRLDTPLARLMVDQGMHSSLIVPMPVPDDPDATLNVMSFLLFDPTRRFSHEDVALGVELARRAAPALEHAVSYEREQHTAEVLQRNLLPDRLPSLPGVTFSACYVPGLAGVSVGGDWYDVLPLTDGRVLLAVGDVVGLGIPAATNMGRIRTVLQYCALEDPDPATVLARLNAYLRALPDAEMATLALLLYDPGSERGLLASAGHLPPLLRPADGPVRQLPGGGGAPLRASATSRYENQEVEIGSGSTVVLYTDGIVERRGESLDEGFARLSRVLESVDGAPDDLAGHLVERIIGDRTPPDDTAVLTMHVCPPADFELSRPARPEELARVRAALRRWLGRSGAADDEAAEVVLAVNEAVANAVIHAYGIGGGEVMLSARLRSPARATVPERARAPERATVPPGDMELEVVVRDTGRWRPPGRSGSNGGRGFRMMRGLMDEVAVDRGEHETAPGTTVVLRRRLTGFPTP